MKLRQEISLHDERYEKNRPIISDGEYDALYRELVALEEAHPEFDDSDSPTKRVVTSLVDELVKVKHSQPMLSQQKTNTEKGIRDWYQKGNGRVLAQQKLDGLTIVLIYDNGTFQQAVTRGDGYIGEDVTHTVRTFTDVPNRISFQDHLEARMEAIIPFEEFERINEDGTYSNPRNLASGTVRQLDASVAASRNLLGIVFDLVVAEGMTFTTDEAQLQFLSQQGFHVVPYRVFDESEALVDYCTKQAPVERETLAYAIDGLVLKFDELSVRDEMGYTSKFPRWGLAYKFAALEATSTLRRVVIQVGKSGQITPVAEFDEVDIDGVRIHRATLHHYGMVYKKDLRLGDRVVIARANDVIPQVVGPISTLRTGQETLIEEPTDCPSCGSKLIVNGGHLFCPNKACKPQVLGRLEHFASRQALQMDGLGEKAIDLLVEQGLLQSPLDFFHLAIHKDIIIGLDGVGEKKFQIWLDSVESTKQQPFRKVLYALSINNIGQSASRDIAKAFSMEELLSLAKNKNKFLVAITNLPDFGLIMAESFYQFLIEEEPLIRQLKAVGLQMTKEENKTGTQLAGKTFVITGKLSIGRDEMKAKIEAMGGKVSGSVSKKTDYLLMGDGEEGSTKHQKAIELGLSIISEEQFYQL
jgi:DNA ligase (NAD+)